MCVGVSWHGCGSCLHLYWCKYANRFLATLTTFSQHSTRLWNVLKICKIVVHFYILSIFFVLLSFPFHLDNCPGARIPPAYGIQTPFCSYLSLIWLHRIFPQSEFPRLHLFSSTLKLLFGFGLLFLLTRDCGPFCWFLDLAFCLWPRTIFRFIKRQLKRKWLGMLILYTLKNFQVNQF